MLLLCLCAALPVATTAHEGATGIVKERMMAMEDIGTAMKEITAMLRGQKAYDPQSLAAHARRIRDQSGAALSRLFPEDSLRHPSEASSEIWQRWDRFEALAQELGSRAETLAVAAEKSAGQAQPGSSPGRDSGQFAMASADHAGPSARDLPMAEYAGLARNCAACHREFRIKK